ncbi:MAG TPA: TadE/TadG family type IV pilus assembly protein [Chloroflexota bacterium]
MRAHRYLGERGQTIVEFALILTTLLLMTGGLMDVGRGFYANNVVAAAARNGARWGSVVGGTCAPSTAVSTSDFCNRLGLSGATSFWNIPGNEPKQGWNSYCPPYAANTSSYFYTASDFASTLARETTIVGAVVDRFDSNSGSSGFLVGRAMPGFDLSRLFICIDGTSANAGGPPAHGDFVRVEVTYVFQPASALFGSFQLNLGASSQFVVE